ncbi:MAG: AI-2E family transporter [Alphaproteobacteria bacterium]|nr:AI-2E family transporter [Alphaproteobacteria bacterium]
MPMLTFDPANKSQVYQLIAGISSVTLILVGCMIILVPFFPAILLATILALSTWPAFMWLNKKLGYRTRLAALLMTLALAFCFIVPLTIIGTSSAENFETISDLVTDALQGDTASVGNELARIPYAGDLLAKQWRSMTADKETFLKVVEDYAGMTNEGLVKLGASIARGLLDLTLGVLIAYFFFRHGTRAAVRISNLIDRFGGAYGQHLLDISKNTLIGVVYGMLGTALAQGALAAFGFWLMNVPGASFLGLMTFFLSFTPIGPPLIWIPATLWLYSEGHLYSAVFMGLWGLLAVSTIDNVLRPYFISLRGNLPFLLVLLGVVGGIIAFGFIGNFIGPTLLALAYALLIDWSKTREDTEKAAKEKAAE